MKIFDIWPFSKRNKTEGTITQKTPEPTELKPTIDQILEDMFYYVEKAENTLCSTMPEEDFQSKSKYKDLDSIGLGNTLNARILKREIDKVDSVRRDHFEADKMLQWLGLALRTYGVGTFLVSRTNFINMCRDRNLYICTINQYNGAVSNGEIGRVKDILLRDVTAKAIGLLTKPTDEPREMFVESIFRVGSYHINNYPEFENTLEKASKYIKTHFGIVRPRYNNMFEGKCLLSQTGEYLSSLKYSDQINAICREIRYDRLFVACDNEFIGYASPGSKNRRYKDNILFRFCPYGVLVHMKPELLEWNESKDKYDDLFNRLTRNVNYKNWEP